MNFSSLVSLDKLLQLLMMEESSKLVLDFACVDFRIPAISPSESLPSQLSSLMTEEEKSDVWLLFQVFTHSFVDFFFNANLLFVACMSKVSFFS